MDNVVKQTELLEKTGVYDEDLKRRFALTLKYNGMKGKKVLVIGMNPASNSVQVFDNTTNYLLNNLGIMGYSEIVVWNLFADICTKLKPTQTGDNTKNMEYLQELLNEKFNAVLIGWGNTFIGNRCVEEAKRQVCEYLKPHAKKVYELVDTEEVNVKHLLCHAKLGMAEWNGEKIFKGAKGVGIDSKYTGKLRVSPKGTYANYKKMLKEDVIGHTPMEFLLSASISGLLVDYLKESISVENIMVHMIGESSTGKTTGALLAVSCGSAPDFLGNNFVFSFQDTLNSLMRLIPNSYPTLIDEGSLLTDRDMTQTLYSLSSGTEKRRLSGGMEVNESSRFRTALFLTSEKSILAQCNMNTGLLTRNFEFQNVTWTSSAESADRIKSVVTENYGHVIPRVAKWLLAQDRQELVEKIVQETNAVIKRAREAKTYNNLTERTAKQSALILVAVDIVNEVLKLKLNKEAIGDFMEEHSLVNSVEQVSIGKRAMEWLLQFISKNYTQFLSKDSPKEISNCRGKLENMQTVLLNTDEESGMRLKVTDSEFMKILKEGHFSEKATVLKEWKEMGYLKAQSDRYISRIKIVGDIQVKGYIIQLPVPSNKIGGDGEKDYEEVLEERRKRINKPRQVIKDEYVEDDFFSIDDDDDLDFPEDWK